MNTNLFVDTYFRHVDVASLVIPPHCHYHFHQASKFLCCRLENQIAPSKFSDRIFVHAQNGLNVPAEFSSGITLICQFYLPLAYPDF